MVTTWALIPETPMDARDIKGTFRFDGKIAPDSMLVEMRLSDLIEFANGPGGVEWRHLDQVRQENWDRQLLDSACGAAKILADTCGVIAVDGNPGKVIKLCEGKVREALELEPEVRKEVQNMHRAMVRSGFTGSGPDATDGVCLQLQKLAHELDVASRSSKGGIAYRLAKLAQRDGYVEPDMSDDDLADAINRWVADIDSGELVKATDGPEEIVECSEGNDVTGA
jgi:hypothetical protein